MKPFHTLDSEHSERRNGALRRHKAVSSGFLLFYQRRGAFKKVSELGEMEPRPPPRARLPGRGSGHPLLLQSPTAHKLPRLRRRTSTAERSYPTVRGQGRRPRGATPLPRSGGCTDTGGLRGATPRSRSGGPAVRRYHSFKVRSSGCALLEQP